MMRLDILVPIEGLGVHNRPKCISDRVLLFEGEVSSEFDVISKPKNVCLSTET